MTEELTIKVIVADDHAVVREGITRILATSDRIELVGEAETGDQAWLLIKDLTPDVALLDIRMPSMTGIDIIKSINSADLNTKSLILTNYDNPDYILEAISEGAHGYILKAIDPNSLIKSVIAVYEGEVVLDPEVASLVAKTWRERNSRTSSTMGISSLTTREKETLKLACDGLRNREISDEMGISVRTVEGHFNRIFSKLGVSSRTEAVLQAVSEPIQ
ncbi:MAG: response regulator transcription factor [Chloroflexota bacterium]|jgi:DNA-binding NarL/FixJ family response regulator|nr:response regulator transcription factor [Chloroflexota bacterium]MEE3346449.1 response regulator transcription factor [Chloroflexota bacterium]